MSTKILLQKNVGSADKPTHASSKFRKQSLAKRVMYNEPAFELQSNGGMRAAAKKSYSFIVLSNVWTNENTILNTMQERRFCFTPSVP